MSHPIGHAVRWPTFFVVVPNYNHARYLEAWSHLSAKTTCSRHFLYGPMLRSLKLIRYHPTFTLFLPREVVRRRPMWPHFSSHLNKKLDFILHRRNAGMGRVRLA